MLHCPLVSSFILVTAALTQPNLQMHKGYDPHKILAHTLSEQKRAWRDVIYLGLLYAHNKQDP